MGLLFKEKFMGTKLQKNPAKQMTGFFLVLRHVDCHAPLRFARNDAKRLLLASGDQQLQHLDG